VDKLHELLKGPSDFDELMPGVNIYFTEKYAADAKTETNKTGTIIQVF
jgi:hypothetical protein